MARVFGITGGKNSGKTTLVARLVAHFTGQGLRVSTIKNASHSFTLDREGTDTHAHSQAGAQEVAIVAGNRWAVIHHGADGAQDEPLEAMLARLAPSDLVLLEGFKSSPFPKLQVMRRVAHENNPMWSENPSIVAVASDHTVKADALPCFEIDDVTAIARFILQATVDS